MSSVAPNHKLPLALLAMFVLGCQSVASDDGAPQGGDTASGHTSAGGFEGRSTGGTNAGGVGTTTGGTRNTLAAAGGRASSLSAKSGTATTNGGSGSGYTIVDNSAKGGAGIGGVSSWSTGGIITSVTTGSSAVGGGGVSSSARRTSMGGVITTQSSTSTTTTGTSAGGSAGQSSTGSGGLGWPIDCELDVDCSVGYPDIDEDNVAFDCGAPGYQGHQGSDIGISWEAMDAGTDVYAALSGEVLWVFDGNYDRCPNDTEPSCQAPTVDGGPNVHSGYMVCTDGRDEYCVGTNYSNGCYWCFYGSNVVVIRHPNDHVVFATRYDHLRRGSILVTPGQRVERGQKIAQVGSAGNSTGPHLHFEVWVGGFYQLAEPWAGTCGPNHDASLWDPALGLP